MLYYRRGLTGKGSDGGTEPKESMVVWREDTEEWQGVTERKKESRISVSGEGDDMAGRQSVVRERVVLREGEWMAWSERQVSRPDLSCRKLFMSPNKMMLQLAYDE